jgi:UDP-glucose:(heptosyl)LPS alpha-1,3-glucosyltransferase
MTIAILQVVREFSLDGGVETVAYELQRAWEAAGIDSTVMASLVPEGPDRPNIRLVASYLARIGTRGRLRYLGRLVVVPWFTLAATRALRRERDVVVLSHGDTLAGDVLVIHAVNKASLVAKRDAGNYRWMLNPMHLWVGWRDRVMIGGLRFRRYVAVSKRVAEELATHYGVPQARIAIIPNGINLSRFHSAPETRAQTRTQIRAEFAIPDTAPLLLFVGHEFERKGLSFVIAAMGHLPDATRLLVVGADDPAPYQRMAAAAGLGERVIFAGPRRDLPALYQASDAFVFPTAYESFSLVCMEALACGVPVFATRAGGIEDYLEDNINGHAITRDAVDIAARLRRFLDDPDLAERLRRGAEATARRFDWTAIAAMYYDLLVQVQRERDSTVTGRS